MEYQSEIQNELADKVIISQNLKLHDKFVLERPRLSYTDKAAIDDELVKYMSNLPKYLEKGKYIQENALSIGVLDWGRLEKWKHNIKHDYSPSSSNTSSFFSNDGSSNNSSSGQSCSSSLIKANRSTLQSHLKAFPQESTSQCVESFEENVGNFKYCEDSKIDPLIMQQKKTETKKHFEKNQSETVEKDSSDIGNYELESCSNGKLNITRGKFTKKSDILEKLNTNLFDQDIPVKQNNPINPAHSSDQKTSTVGAAKARYISPTRLFNIGMNKISRNNYSKEDQVAHKPCTKKETDKSRTSPLKKLLEPLLKSKACQLTEGESRSSASHSGKVKLDQTVKNYRSQSKLVQALLQVVIKNGLPLFTFAVDNNNGIIAATVKKLNTSTKDEFGCLYTYFNVREIKKKSWLNNGGKKGKSIDYIPNVIAQMKVSNLTKDDFLDYFITRNFVLCAVDQQNSGFQPNEELAAIVMKIPDEKTLNPIQDKENLHDPNFVGNNYDKSMTVILPRGAHTMSSKGEPSSLVNRWKSGGICDCGGWDLGCKLRVLKDRTKLDKKSNLSAKCPSTVQFELFDQEGIQENQPVFSLTPFKDGFYSVAFSSSLSHIQAFSICIATLDGNKLSGNSNLSRPLQGKEISSEESKGKDGIKAQNGIEINNQSCYVSYPPPVSPMGRA